MRIGWIGAALLAVAPDASPADFTAYLAGGSLSYTAKRIAGSLLQNAGVTVQWKGPAPPAAGLSPDWLRIELAERTPDGLLPDALAVSYPYAGGFKSITVFSDRIRALAPGVDREASLLGYVLAHEIAHVIQGVDRHSQAGIMKARWTPADRGAIFQRTLGFSQEDVLLMRQRLAALRVRSAAALTGRSGSGSALHRE